MLKWMVMLLALGMLVGSAFGHPQEASPYIVAGPVVQGAPQLPVDWAILEYNGFVFDTRIGEPALPAGLKIESYPAGTVGYYLVTLRVPITGAVKSELTSSGAKILNFMPYNSFLVAMDEAAKARVASSPAVSWVGIFQPGYKVASWFQGLSGTKDVWVQLFPDENVQLAENKLRGMGLGLVSIEAQDAYKILKVKMDLASLSRLAGLREVMWLEPWPEYKTVNQDAQWTTQTYIPGYRKLWARGVNGSRVTLSTGDSGIQVNNLFFYDSAYPIATWGNYPNHRKVIGYFQVTGSCVFGDGSGASWHGTHTAGTIAGDDSAAGGTLPYDGMAIKAKNFFCDQGDNTSSSIYTPADLGTGLYQPAYTGNAGGQARIGSYSWGGGSGYTAQCVQTDTYMWSHRDWLAFYSAGNGGPGANTIGSPGSGKDIVTVGASDNGLAGFNMAGFSSRGPVNDRRKPTIVAPGVQLFSANGAVNNGVQAMSGTSMACPTAAGCGALVRDYFQKGFYPTGDSVVGNRWAYVSAALVKAVLVNSSNNDFPAYMIPDNNIGWGRINLDNTLYFSGDARKLAVYEDSLSAGGTRSVNVDVNTDAEPLKITLVYTDYPGAVGATHALVNNLNLTVTSPGGAQTYLGNVFSGGWSTTGGAADPNNPEECVYIRQPARGTWAVQVSAPTVPNGPQPYALVVTGGLGTIGAQVLSLKANTILDNIPGSNGNNNGMVDIGETVGFVDTIYNGGAAAVTAVTATLRTSDLQVMFNRGDSIANLGNIASGATANNGATPFKLVCRGTPRVVTFTLHLVGTFNDMPYTNDIQFPVRVGLGLGEVIRVITPRYKADSSMIYGLAYDGTNLRVAEWINGRIYKVNPNTGDTVSGGSFQGPTASQVTDLSWDWGDNTLWETAQLTHQVYKLNAATGAVIRQFASRAVNYTIGLELRGGGRLAADTLWETDRGLAVTDPKAYYKCDTLGNQIQSFTGGQLPAYLTVPAGPRCLAYEPNGQPYWAGGTLLHVVTDFGGAGNALIASHLYEIRQNGANLDTVPAVNHHYIWGWNSRAVERDSGDWNYWISAFVTAGYSNIYKVRGFYDKPLPPSGAELGPVALPTSFALGQSYPNPMVGGAMIKYALPRDVAVSLKVYNISGQLVKTLVSGTEKAGYKQVSWEGRSEQGHRVSAGVYFYRMQAGEFTATKKLVVVR
jgi:hypothetical protein